MVIKRSGLESTDFPDIETGKQIAPVHPGEILRVELLDPPGMPVNALAKALRVPTRRASTTWCSASARSRQIQRCGLAAISARARSSGSICRPATTCASPLG